MKYKQYKEIIHLTFFGYDDELRGSASSLPLTHPLSIANHAVNDTKVLRFRFNPITDVILTNHARVVIECATIPTNLSITGNAGNVLVAPLTIRTSSITPYKSFDTANNGFNPL